MCHLICQYEDCCFVITPIVQASISANGKRCTIIPNGLPQPIQRELATIPLAIKTATTDSVDYHETSRCT